MAGPELFVKIEFDCLSHITAKEGQIFSMHYSNSLQVCNFLPYEKLHQANI